MKAFRLSPWLLLILTTARAEETVDYLAQVKPILQKHCYRCHGPDRQRAGLRLDTARLALEGSNAGPVIVPGNSRQSKLIHALSGKNDVKQMPPRKDKLPDKEIALIALWIDQGAKAPLNEKPAARAEKVAQHWSFRPVVRPELPKVQQTGWAQNPIDLFILAKLEEKGIQPSPEADRVTLIRRLFLDLVGLPPSIADIDAFLNDQRPDAYERLVDRLLASPHYGERWGRHWLDLARYADSNGFTIDGPRSMWPYRDWVIHAFNQDMPFDQFTIEQIAGDMLPHPTRSQIVATGFHRNTLKNEEGGIDREQFRVESVVDRVGTTGTVFLGLTIACCQCHDHKFDPISQREYYQIFAFLNNCDEPTIELPTPEQEVQRARIRAQIKEVQRVRDMLDSTTPEKQTKWEEALTTSMRAKLPKTIQTILNVPPNGRSSRQEQTLAQYFRELDRTRHLLAAAGERHPLAGLGQLHFLVFRGQAEKRIAELKKQEPVIPTTLVMRERKTPRVTNVLIQGDFTRKGIRVNPGVPSVLPPLNKTASPTRLDFARWLVDPQNPLTPRVTVNRFWQRFFGLGIVETENDFGTQGTPPSHPELLDWLASEFVRQNWSIKKMHRLIVTSATYRQSSRHRPDLHDVDPRNRLLARQNRIRVEAEIVRDVALAASGLLYRKIGGPSVFPPQPDGVYRFTQVNKNWRADSGPNRYRRGMYTFFWRSAPHPGLTVFDAPEANSCCSRRNRSNTPLQALTLLNDEAHVEFAQGLACRLLSWKDINSDSKRIRRLYRLLLARLPNPKEEQLVLRLLDIQRSEFAASPEEARLLAPKTVPPNTPVHEVAAWTAVARVLLNLDEFITRE
ncbi:MAG: chromosome segregation protein [Gemmatales bacterium]|nr:MAG: chromosome segregation protein [Gemmatales bacterium]